MLLDLKHTDASPVTSTKSPLELNTADTASASSTAAVGTGTPATFAAGSSSPTQPVASETVESPSDVGFGGVVFLRVAQLLLNHHEFLYNAKAEAPTAAASGGGALKAGNRRSAVKPRSSLDLPDVEGLLHLFFSRILSEHCKR